MDMKKEKEVVGSVVQVMDMKTVVAKTSRIDDIDYTLYKTTDGKGIVRSFDLESGEVADLRSYPTFAQAEEVYDKVICVLRG